VLITVAGSFAVGHRTIARGWAPAHPGLVLWACIPAAHWLCHCRRWFVVSNGPDPVRRLSFLVALVERLLPRFLAAGFAG
jgi:hypothetical protein